MGQAQFYEDGKPIRGTGMKAQETKRPQIAVLDANPAILDYVHRILSDRFNVSLFTEATEMTRSLTESPAPDLLMMDWHVSDDDSEDNALRLLSKTRASNPALPIIMLACSAELKEVVAATRMGATDVILKPFRKSDIDLAVLDLSNPLLFHANRRGDLLLRQSFFDSGLPAVFPKRRT